MMPNTVIKVNHLTKIYKLYDKPIDRLKESLHPLKKQYHKEFYALNDINFEIKKGETIGIIGKNGAGKSTLLKIITGVLTPTSGSMHVNGRIASLLELGAGFNPEYTGIENIYFQGSLMGYSHEEMDHKIDDIISFADIDAFVHQPVKMYSSGMFARLAFAVAINVDPDILIVDEALSVGDARFQVRCYRKFEEFKEKGKTVLFVSHSSSDIVRLCSRVIWLSDGKVRKIGLAKNIIEEYLAWMLHDTGVQKTSTTSIQHISSFLDTSADVDLVPIPHNACITGDGGAYIDAVGMFIEKNKRITLIDGPKKINIVFRVVTKIKINNPYFGFQIINEKGIRVMGCNNHILEKSYPSIPPDTKVLISFSFAFPEIENGTYLLAVGVSDGTLDNHIRHNFVADAYEFSFASVSLFQQQAVLLKLHECAINIL